LNKWLPAIAFSVLLLVPAGIENAFGGANIKPVSILFLGIDENDCKVFQINQGLDGFQKGLPIRTVIVNFEKGSFVRPTTIDPPTKRIDGGNFDRFEYEPTKLGKSTAVPMATLKVCFPDPKSPAVRFTIQVATEPKFQIGALRVQEQFTDAKEVESFRFASKFIIPTKELNDDCTGKLAIVVDSNNVIQNTLTLKCTDVKKTTEVVVTGDVDNPLLPALNAVAIEPLGDTFLLVSDVCLLFFDNSFICPTNLGLNLLMELPTEPFQVGGSFTPIDTTMVLLGATETTASWLIPAIVAAIGIGIVIARKF